MFEYHGWITIYESAGDDDGDPLALVERIRRRVDEVAGPYLLDLRFVNGVPSLHLAGFPNHRGLHGGDVEALFAAVGALAPGSYGLLYVRDDESADHANEFRVFRMARGRVTEHADPFLSPCVPTVEDEMGDGS